MKIGLMLTAAAVVLTACSGPASSAVTTPISEAPSIIAAMGGAEWHYVALGDSSSMGFPAEYAKHIAADLGVKLWLQNHWIGGLTSNDLLKNVREDKGLRAEIADAEVITFWANPGTYTGWRIVTGKSSDTYDCSNEATGKWIADLDAIIAELFALRKGKPTIIRTYSLYVPIYKEWKQWGQYDEYKRCWEAQAKASEELAAAHKIGFAPVYDALNGPNHDQDPKELGYIYDRLHTNGLGSEAMAEAFWKLGYGFIVP